MATRLSSPLVRLTRIAPASPTRAPLRARPPLGIFPGSRPHLRSMASATTGAGASAPRKYEWLVVIPDIPGTLEKRLAVRPEHFTNLKTFAESGEFKMGGAILSEVPADDEPGSLQFCGSTLVVTATSREDILATLRNDVYAKSGVWDLEKVQMWPLKCAFRNP